MWVLVLRGYNLNSTATNHCGVSFVFRAGDAFSEFWYNMRPTYHGLLCLVPARLHFLVNFAPLFFARTFLSGPPPQRVLPHGLRRRRDRRSLWGAHAGACLQGQLNRNAIHRLWKAVAPPPWFEEVARTVPYVLVRLPSLCHREVYRMREACVGGPSPLHLSAGGQSRIKTGLGTTLI